MAFVKPLYKQAVSSFENNVFITSSAHTIVWS